jgi:signal transduction histidine kinase
LARVKTHLKILDATRKIEKQAQELEDTHDQLVQAEKMASLGTLLAGVAHELNNPAASIMMNSEFFAKLWKNIIPILDQYSRENGSLKLGGLSFNESKEEINKLITGLLDGSSRIKNMIDELKSFSRKENSIEKEKLDVSRVIQFSINLTHNMIKNATKRFACDLNKHLPFLYGSFQKLEQVFINLIQNACQALPDDTRGIYISTTYNKEKNEIIVKVKDEGEGIKAEDLKYITDPFFTTRREIGGTGLGLAVSLKIIQEHGGKINFESKPGKGTTVTVHLPIEPFNKKTNP